MMETLDRLESQARSRPRPSSSRPPSRTPAVVCHRCGQEGHFARGCASPRCLNQPPYPQDRPTPNERVAAISDGCNFVVSGTVDGIATTFLVDTGAAVSLLRKDIWDKLLRDSSSLTPWTGSPLVGVAGNPLEVWGSAVVDIAMAGEVFRSTIVVTSAMTTEAILGGDFLRANDCTLEVGKRVLRFVGRGVALTLNDTSTEPVIIQARVTLGETVQIPAHSEKEVVAKVDKPLTGGVWLLEGDKSGRLPVSIANALVNATSPYVHMRMLNNQSDPVVLTKGTKLGVAEEATIPVPVATVDLKKSEGVGVSEKREVCCRKWLKAVLPRSLLQSKGNSFSYYSCPMQIYLLKMVNLVALTL